MKKVGLIKLLVGLTLAASGAFAVGSAVNHKKAEAVFADEQSGTVYYAVQSSTLSTYTAKLHINIGDNNTWREYDFEPTKYTYNNGNSEYYVLKADFSVKYNGVDVMQIQLYDGSTWKSEQQPYGSWTTLDTFNGKMYVHNVGWVAYTHNSVKTATVYLDVFDWSNLYVYTFEYIGSKKIETNGAWPGTSVLIKDGNLKFNNGKLQKATFEYVNSSKAQFIFHDNTSSNKSSDMAYTEGSYYWHNGSAWTKDATRGQAAAFVYDLNSTRLGVTASGNVKAFSICGLTPSTWVNRYNALSSTAKSYVDSATMYTYKNQSSSGADTTVTFAEVMSQLSSMVSGNNSSKLLSQNLIEDNNLWIIIVISLLSVSAISGFFFIKKRQEN